LEMIADSRRPVSIDLEEVKPIVAVRNATDD
jgi:hypothetical protein